MAETLRKLVEKKRFHSSSSEELSPPLLVVHEYKKPRSEEFAFVDATDHESVTEQVPALEMAEKLDEKLQAILTKLEKLDAIEKSVKILQETLAGMDSRIQSLESAQASAYRDINDLKESLNFAEDKCKKTTECFNKYKQQISLQMTELEQKGTIVEGKITELENKNLYLEAYSRRENITFENIKEVPELNTHHEDTECLLRNFLESELGYKDASCIEIQRVHHLNKKKDAKPRPIIARFLNVTRVCLYSGIFKSHCSSTSIVEQSEQLVSIICFELVIVIVSDIIGILFLHCIIHSGLPTN